MCAARKSCVYVRNTLHVSVNTWSLVHMQSLRHYKDVPRSPSGRFFRGDTYHVCLSLHSLSHLFMYTLLFYSESTTSGRLTGESFMVSTRRCSGQHATNTVLIEMGDMKKFVLLLFTITRSSWSWFIGPQMILNALRWIRQHRMIRTRMSLLCSQHCSYFP